ncbi:hypothetical protein TruAng_011504 [Truncatella angustata]|nr:hypothetical protein TruAng_011504 [Truncatella angustata]
MNHAEDVVANQGLPAAHTKTSYAVMKGCQSYIEQLEAFATAVVQENDRLQKQVDHLSKDLQFATKSCMLQAQVVPIQQKLINIWESRRLRSEKWNVRSSKKRTGLRSEGNSIPPVHREKEAASSLMLLADLAEQERRIKGINSEHLQGEDD